MANFNKLNVGCDMNVLKTTYTSFLNSKNSHLSSHLQENAGRLIEYFRPAKLSHSAFAPVVFLVDYATKKYVHVEESCFDLLGFTASYFLETGLEEYLSRWHKADFHIMDTKVFPANMAFLNHLLAQEFNNYLFSYNYRFLTAADSYVTVLQRFSYIAGPDEAAPLGVIGVIFDITHFKNDLSIVHTIEKTVNIEGERVNELVFKKVYPVVEEAKKRLLSKREIEVVQLMAKGLSSKQIAAHTHLSINTINNHRKNMLSKTACKSSSELITYALKHGFVE